jgi:hypothetical protein
MWVYSSHEFVLVVVEEESENRQHFDGRREEPPNDQLPVQAGDLRPRAPCVRQQHHESPRQPQDLNSTNDSIFKSIWVLNNDVDLPAEELAR